MSLIILLQTWLRPDDSCLPEVRHLRGRLRFRERGLASH